MSNLSGVRRSARQHTPTQRAMDYQSSISSTKCFPIVSEFIAVHWDLDGTSTWWPAEVLAIDSASSSTSREERREERRGQIRYSAYKHYASEQSMVQFSSEKNGLRRHVSIVHADGTTSKSCSWIFANEVPDADCINGPSSSSSPHGSDAISNDFIKDTRLRTSRRISTPSAVAKDKVLRTSPRRLASTPPSNQKPQFVNRRTIRSTKSAAVDQGRTQSPTISAQRPIGKSHKQRQVYTPPVTDETVSTTGAILKEFDFERNPSRNTTTAHPFSNAHRAQTRGQSSGGRQTVEERIIGNRGYQQTQTGQYNESGGNFVSPTLVENGVRNPASPSAVPPPNYNLVSRAPMPSATSHPALHSYADTVLVCLKWLLMKRLEKPLKSLTLPQLSERGVASIVISVRCDCDYFSFSRIASLVATSFNIPYASTTTPSRLSSRVRFHPDFARTQSGSAGVDNLSISFTSLSDLMDLLGVRDEDDYEKILCSEIDCSRHNILQILGTLQVLRNSEQSSSIDGSNSNNTLADHQSSVSTSNNVTTMPTTLRESLRICIGSAPHGDLIECTTVGKEGDTHRGFQCFVLEQDCSHFSEQQNCYKTKWRSLSKPSTFKISTPRGLQKDPDRSKFFVLNWTQLKPPSTGKWSRDAQTFGRPSPGRIELSIPVVYSSSRANVLSLSSLLDNCIEEVLLQRIAMHTSLARHSN